MESNSLLEKIILKATSFFFLVGIAMSYNLWFSSDRYTPYLSIIGFDEMGTISVYMSIVLVAGLVTSLFVTSKYIVFQLVANIIVLSLLDRMKWQPWVYMYLIAFLLFIFQGKKNISYIFMMKYVIAAVYLWAGIHKLSSSYSMVVSQIVPMDYGYIKSMLYVGPYVEIIMGLTLIFVPLKKGSSYVYVAFHMSLVLYFILVGSSNNIIVPWNLYFMVCIFLLAYMDGEHEEVSHLKNNPARFGIVLFCCLPLLNYYSLLDNYLSFSLYSGKMDRLYIIFDNADVTGAIRSEYDGCFLSNQDYKIELSGRTDVEIVGYYKKVLNELNVPPVLEKNVSSKIKTLLESKHPHAKVVLINWREINPP